MRGVAAVVVALSLLFVAGCGSSGGGDTQPTTGEVTPVVVSKKTYVRKADAICKEIPKHYTERLEALRAEMKKKGAKATKSETTLKAAVPPLYTAIKELRTLAPPQGDEQKAETFVEAMEAGVKGLERRPNSKLSGKGSPLAEFANLTRAYGFKYCSSL